MGHPRHTPLTKLEAVAYAAFVLLCGAMYWVIVEAVKALSAPDTFHGPVL